MRRGMPERGLVVAFFASSFDFQVLMDQTWMLHYVHSSPLHCSRFGSTVSTEPAMLSRDRPTPMSNLWTDTRVQVCVPACLNTAKGGCGPAMHAYAGCEIHVGEVRCCGVECCARLSARLAVQRVPGLNTNYLQE